MNYLRFVLLSLLACAGCSAQSSREEAAEAPSASQAARAAGASENAADAAPAITEAYDPKAVTGMSRIEDKAYFLTTAKWPTNAVPVCWNSAAEAARPEANWIRQSITATWEAASKVRFIGWGTCATNAVGIRIAVEDSGPHTKGLGKNINGNANGMVLNRTFVNWSPACAASEKMRESCVRSIAVHEFGHAIGFAHEQNRPDTPGECLKPPQGSNGDVMLTPWDVHSVMNYCNPEYNNNGQLSQLDRQAVASIYK